MDGWRLRPWRARVGSNHSVTSRTLARARGVHGEAITKAVMATLTLEGAARIAVRVFYEQNGLIRLPWTRHSCRSPATSICAAAASATPNVTMSHFARS